MRINAGAAYTYWLYFGSINIATYGGGAKFLVPGWNFSPVLGVNGTGGYGVFEDAGLFDFESSSSTKGNKETASFGFGYFNFGGDYQAANGFNVGFGLNWAFWKSEDVDFKYPLPYLNIGWFF